MKYLEQYKKRLQMSGNSASESKINRSKNFLNRNFDTSPSFYTVEANGMKMDAIVNKTKRFDEKTINFRPDTEINIGSLIKFKDDNYLLIEKDATEVHVFGKMKLCNLVLQYQRACRIYSSPSVVTNRTSYKDDIYPDRTMILPSGQFEIIIPTNEDTKLLKIDDRIFIEEDVYKISYIDSVITKGITVLTVNKDRINPETDNREKRIANYKKCNTKLFISPTPSTVKVGETLKLDVIAKVGDEIVDVNKTYISSNEDIAIVDENGKVEFLETGEVEIFVHSEGEQAKVHFKVESVGDRFSIEIAGKNTIYKGASETYTATIKDLDELVEEKVEWDVKGDSISIEKVRGNTATVKGVKLGTSKLICNWNDVRSFIEITVINLW